MAIPDNRLSTEPVPGEYLPPDDRLAYPKLIDWELGGIALNDPSQGHMVRIWVADTDAHIIRIYPEPEEGEPITGAVTFIEEPEAEIVELSFTFDQNMRPTIVYVILLDRPEICEEDDPGYTYVTKMYWYDTLIESFRITTYGTEYTSPRVTLDDKRLTATQQGFNDILFFYHRDNNLYYRQQRDRYTVERLLLVGVPGREILYCGMTNQNRVQLQWAVPDDDY